eukprot:14168-Amphidinium_carterae.1
MGRAAPRSLAAEAASRPRPGACSGKIPARRWAQSSVTLAVPKTDEPQQAGASSYVLSAVRQRSDLVCLLFIESTETNRKFLHVWDTTPASRAIISMRPADLFEVNLLLVKFIASKMQLNSPQRLNDLSPRGRLGHAVPLFHRHEECATSGCSSDQANVLMQRPKAAHSMQPQKKAP